MRALNVFCNCCYIKKSLGDLVECLQAELEQTLRQ